MGGQGMYQYAPPPPAGELRLSSSEGYAHGGVKVCSPFSFPGLHRRAPYLLTSSTCDLQLEHSPSYRRDLTYDPYAKSPSSTSYTRQQLGMIDSPYGLDPVARMGGPLDPLGRPLDARVMGGVDAMGRDMGMPRNISLQPMDGVIAEQLNANWGRLLKANP